jgi:hypothetical protein
MSPQSTIQILWLRSLIAACVSLVAGGEVHAQPIGTSTASIECTIANADLVFVAKLVDYGSKKQFNGIAYHEGTIDIEETLKDDIFHDEPYRKLSVRLPYYSESDLANWKDHSLRLLVTVNEDDMYGTRVIALTNETLEVLTADFKLLRDPEAVIRIAKETVRRFPVPVKRIQTFRLSVPREVFAGTHWESFHYLNLTVPVDERLEKWAQDGIRSERYTTREESARALRYFKSDDNIARVKSLLNDTKWAYFKVASENNGVEVRHYGVRQAAFGTLKFWGVNVDQPVFRENVRK